MESKKVQKWAAPRPLFTRKALIALAAVTVVLVAAVILLISFLHPMPPRVLTLATGPEGSAYDVFGKRYKIMLAKQGIDLRLVPTAGGVENLKLLMDPHSKVDAGFVMGGISQETDTQELVSLGTIGYEPMWFFTRQVAKDHVLKALKGKRISVGPEGSDSRALVSELLKRHGLEIESFKLQGLSPEETEKELLAGNIDAAILVSSYASPIVRRLAKADGINLANFTRADAYVALFPSLTKRVFPAGVANLEKDRPPRDTTLLATKTSLIVKGDLHPALQYLLLEAASQIHTRSGIFQKAGEFPAAESLEFPLSPNAQHYYKSGRPFLQRYLPFWFAALVEQLVVILIPLMGIMYPLGKGLSSLYGWGMQRKIFLIYGELHWLEMQIDKLEKRPPPKEILERMDQLENRANRVRVASQYIPMLYNLKETLAYVRGRLDRQGKRR